MTEIWLSNTRTRSKERFDPIDPDPCPDVCLRPDGL